MLIRVESFALVVAKDHVRVDVGVQIVNAVPSNPVLEGSDVLAGGIVGAGLAAIAVDVHVIVLAAIALRVQEDGAGDVTAVRERVAVSTAAVSEAAGELVGALSGLFGRRQSAYGRGKEKKKKKKKKEGKAAPCAGRRAS